MATCIHELDPRWCATCRQLPDPGKEPDALRQSHGLGPWFPAAYRGSCTNCDTEIEPGDRIRADGDAGYSGKCCGEDDDDD